MRLATLKIGTTESAALRRGASYVPVWEINRCAGTDWPETIWGLIEGGRLGEMKDWLKWEGRACLAEAKLESIPVERAAFAPLYRSPRKIWGIGLNYVEHASDLDETAPSQAPASFMKPATTIIGHGDTIRIPRQSRRTTAEAELGIVFGMQCKDVPSRDWLSVVAGFTPLIDMTAEDILRRNPRYLTLSKSFDTFFSFGPELVTVDEVPNVSDLRVRTIHNDRLRAENMVRNMTFAPADLVAFHTAVMTMLPGDIIASGTPGAVSLADGDRVECRIDGFDPLRNRVRDLKID